MDNKPQTTEPAKPRPTATELLNTFMTEHKISIVYGDMKIRQIKDGAIIVERPIIGVEYVQ